MTAPTSANYFAAFLAGIGAPVTPQNLAALYDVEHYEGINQRYNPLNVVQKEPGSTQFNSVGVQAYPDLQTGVKGAVDLFTQNSVWNGVIAALRQGTDTNAVLDQFDQVYDRWSPGTRLPSLSATALASVAGAQIGPHSGTLTGSIITPGGAANAIGSAVGVPGLGTVGSAAAGAVGGAAGAIGSAVSGLFSGWGGIALKLLMVGTGLALVVGGGYKSVVRPAQQTVETKVEAGAEKAAPVAAAVA